MNSNNIGAEGARAVAAALTQHKVTGSPRAPLYPRSRLFFSPQGLAKLSLENNNIGVEGARAVADALKHHRVRAFGTKDLTKLGLSNNSIGDEGARALAEALNYHRVRESPPSDLFTHTTFLFNKGS